MLKKIVSSGFTPRLSSDVLIRAWSVFTFDRTKQLSVYSTLALIPCPYSPLHAICRIEKVIRNQPSTKAAMDFIAAFRARVPTQDPNVVAWWKQQTTTILSSINPQPSVDDVQMFIGVAKSEGLLFFSQTSVLLSGGPNLYI